MDMVVGVTKRSWCWLSGLRIVRNARRMVACMWSENSARVQACSINDLTHMNARLEGRTIFTERFHFHLT